ncbi:type II toxin-antitoxin system RelE/ParE family toxin [Hominifimenecus sp. rT4P-3]|uniref:type II toxin-antitoxin system RelE/ParE family toxin n=1 Tax=Hominifimenecus sp. rT4P-3 TaxID=3242979 RepID=UPI003DA6242E
MKNSIHYSPEAQNDLDEIWAYISFELCNPLAAESTVNKIMDTVDKLEDFSEIGVSLSSITDIESDYRFLTSANYVIFYRANGQDYTLTVFSMADGIIFEFCFPICHRTTTKDKAK